MSTTVNGDMMSTITAGGQRALDFVSSQENQMLAGRSFLLGFTVSYIISFGGAGAAIAGGAVSAVASLIDAAIRPSIEHYFGGISLLELNRQIFGQTSGEVIRLPSLVRNVMVIALSGAIASVTGSVFGVSTGMYTVTALAIRAAYKMFSEGNASMGSHHLIPVRLY